MGLMMGSLWLDNTWCAGLGWRTDLMVAFHLALMAGLPVMVAGLLRGWGAARVSTNAQTQVVLVLLLGGALLLLGSSVWQGCAGDCVASNGMGAALLSLLVNSKLLQA